jgi:hypothetical protein
MLRVPARHPLGCHQIHHGLVDNSYQRPEYPVALWSCRLCEKHHCNYCCQIFPRPAETRRFPVFQHQRQNDPSTVVLTLAYQVGSFDPRIGGAVSDAITRDPHFTMGSLHRQFSQLLLIPLSSLQHLAARKPVDECRPGPNRRCRARDEVPGWWLTGHREL